MHNFLNQIRRFTKNQQYFGRGEWTAEQVAVEIEQGLALLNSIQQPIVSIFGSHMATENMADYQNCYKLSYELSRRGYAILTGGGGGIMHAANKAAHDNNGTSVGLWAALIKQEEVKEEIYTHKHNLNFVMVRRFLLSIKSQAMIFYPGGYGTLNELFEYITLMETDIIDHTPVVCMGTDYWNGLKNWLYVADRKRDYLLDEQKDFDLLTIADDMNAVLGILPAIK